MKRIGLPLVSVLAVLAAMPAWAQPSPGPAGSGPMGGYSHMWDSGWAWHHGFMMGPVVALLALIGAISLIAWLVRGCCRARFHGCRHGRHGRSRGALDILEERFAKGEIGKDEFE